MYFYYFFTICLLSFAKFNAFSQCVIAHRGFAGIAPENSFLAIDTALSLGACAIEIDVRMTKDSVLVLMHNKRINSTTNGKGKIKNLSIGTIENFSITGGKYKQNIPTLDSVMFYINGRTKLIIELKYGHKGAENMLAHLIQKHNAYDWCAVQSFCDKILINLNTIDKEIELHKLLVYKSRYLPLIIDRKLRIKSLKHYDFVSTIAINHRMAGEKIIKHFQNNGKKVNVWTVKKESSFNKFKNRGADGIISDYPFKSL